MSLDAAITYLKAGWHVLPVENKKALIAWDGIQTTKPTEERVRQWWATWPNAGIAIALGRGSNIIRVDCDGSRASDALQELGGLPETAEFTTVSGGRGFLLQWESWVSTAVIWRGPPGSQHEEIRVQSDGAYTVVPPTPGYSWVRQTPIARASRWLLSWYAEKALRETPSAVVRCDLSENELKEALNAISSDDYDIWLRVGMALQSRDLFEIWEEWSRRSTKFKEGECAKKWATFNGAGVTVATIIHLAKQAGWRSAWSPYEPLTEGGNANVLSRTAADRAMYSPKLGWLAWDSRRWTTGEEAECLVGELQRDSLRLRRAGVATSLARITGSGLDQEQRRRQKMKTLNKIDGLDKAMCYSGTRKIARGSMLCDWTTFNTRPELMNFTNGTLDLMTGELRPHSPGDRLTTLVPRDFVPGSPVNHFMTFLERSLPDPSVRAYLHRKLGSMLLGTMRKELLVLWGPEGDNGKTLIIEMMLLAMGADYAVKTASDLLLRRTSGDDDRNTVMLYGKRFAAASETNEGAKINEALLKELTGGDKITSRHLFKEKFSFDPTHDIVYVTNHKPVLKGTDDALWNRIKLIEFNQSFPVGHPLRVEGLRDLLASEIQGFTAWLVQGCVEYVQSGRVLMEPENIKQSTQAYRQENNPVAKFLEERKYVKTDGVAHRIRKTKLTDAFKAWNNGQVTNVTSQWFGRMMTALGVGSDANYYFLAEVSSGSD